MIPLHSVRRAVLFSMNCLLLLVALLSFALAIGAQTCPPSVTFTPTLDTYGGCVNCGIVGNVTGYFHTQEFSNRWWLIDPLGNPFWLLSVDVMAPLDGGTTYVDVLKAKYGFTNWKNLFEQQAVKRARSWGFNAIGNDSGSTYSWAGNTEKMPGHRILNIGGRGQGTGYAQLKFKDVWKGLDTGGGYRGGYLGFFADVFDPAFAAWAPQAVQNTLLNFPGLPTDPYLVALSTDDGDFIFGLRRGDGVHGGWLAAVTAPRQGGVIVHKTTGPQEYADTTVYMKQAIRDFLKSKYGTIGGLNAAWGSGYTSWDPVSPATVKEAPVANGNGTTINQFFMLGLPLTPGTVTITAPAMDGSTVTATDDGNGHLRGSGVGPGSTIHYPTGLVSVNTASALVDAKGMKRNIHASYSGGSWPKRLTQGTAFMDEDGTSSWMHPAAHDYVNLTGLAPNIVADLDSFRAQMADRYSSVAASAIHAGIPNHLVSNPSPLIANLVSTVSGQRVLKAFARNYDILEVAARPSQIPLLQAIYDLVQKPMNVYLLLTAQADSPLSAFPRTADNDYPTQAARGLAYAADISALTNLTGSDGRKFVLGIDWWEWTDKSTGGEHGNFGLVTNSDNAYDGKEAVVAPGVDPWGYKTGGEVANYGNFLAPVTQANNSVYQLAAGCK